ncbi:hypothetical protein ACXYMO_14620 [Arenibacterium sp. CAU 1754]
MRWLILIAMMVAGPALAQTRHVNPDDLSLTVTVENDNVAPYRQEMVLITLHGVYRRHITLEKMEQPDLSGFNWMQLGQDHWYESQLQGKKVKNMRRRMALFPDRVGELTIGPFVHHLTLTDEGDDWFEHDIQSDPITIRVQPAPVSDDWWFPVRRLEISDSWSNAPDQLNEGEGVLRVIMVKAVGASPDMIPPMPELLSPSAMVFAHPEQRFVELSPEGPVSMAFWRWTVRPSNNTSAILEPISFSYFDTTTRKQHAVEITAQRIAMSEANLPDPVAPPVPATLYAVPSLAGGVAAFGLVLAWMTAGFHFIGTGRLQRWALFDPVRRSLRRAARRGDMAGLRRAAVALVRRDGETGERARLLAALDTAIFGRGSNQFDTRAFAQKFLEKT